MKIFFIIILMLHFPIIGMGKGYTKGVDLTNECNEQEHPDCCKINHHANIFKCYDCIGNEVKCEWNGEYADQYALSCSNGPIGKVINCDCENLIDCMSGDTDDSDCDGKDDDGDGLIDEDGNCNEPDGDLSTVMCLNI